MEGLFKTYVAPKFVERYTFPDEMAPWIVSDAEKVAGVVVVSVDPF